MKRRQFLKSTAAAIGTQMFAGQVRSQGQTTGTVNPGFIWINRYGQLGIEAQIPVNRASGSHVGILVQAHIFFDDVAPTTLGKPLFQ